jgi:hypothetical protein
VRLQPYNKFLTNAGAIMPVESELVAVGIHPSSEVDLVDVGGRILSVGSVMPLTDGGREHINPVRRAPAQLEVAGDQDDVGQLLVLQFYEPGDMLVAPGARAPVTRSKQIAAASVPTTAATAALAFRLPFHGRRQACIRFARSTNAADLSMIVVGLNWGDRRCTDVSSVVVQAREQAAEAWWNGTGAAPVRIAGTGATQLQYREVYVGGGGDTQEAFDELAIYVFGGAGGTALVEGEAFGERIL